VADVSCECGQHHMCSAAVLLQVHVWGVREGSIICAVQLCYCRCVCGGRGRAAKMHQGLCQNASGTCKMGGANRLCRVVEALVEEEYGSEYSV
jgi:hypothetical protein